MKLDESGMKSLTDMKIKKNRWDVKLRNDIL